MARVFIPLAMQALTGGQCQIDVPGATVRELVDQLERQYPGFASGICQGARLRSGLAVTIDGNLATLGLLQSVPPTAEVHFLPALGGG